jgi:hypothetical protein
MPKTIIDYSKTIIYKIINYDCPELVYVGSTTNFTKRKQHHKDAVFNQNSLSHNLKIYKTIRENGGWDCWKMIVICEYPCDNKRQAELEEDKYMMELKANLNMNRASRTMKQHYEDNKENIKDKKKQDYKDNKGNIKDYNKQWRENNKDKLKDYNKQYNDDNKDQRKQYYMDNKDQIKENKSKKCTCECGAIIQRCIKSQHIKTMKHQKYLNTIKHINGVV